MTSRWIMATVAGGCIAAAGAGGYLAVRTATHTSQAAASPETAMAVWPADVDGGPAPTPTSGTAAAQDAVVPRAVPPAERPAPQPVPVVRRSSRPEPARAPAGGDTRAREGTRQPPVVADIEPADGTFVLPARTSDYDERSAPPASPAPAPVLSVPTSTTFPVDARPAVWLGEPPVEYVGLAPNTVIGIRLDTTVSSDTARVEDEVRARVTRPVVVDGRTVVPNGTRLVGFVSEVEAGGRVRGEARIGIRFTAIEIGGQRSPISTEAIYRAGESPTGEATAKIGAGAVVGSILGGVFGGKRGAVIGGAAGAAGGTAVVMRGEGNPATLESGTPLTVRLTDAADIPIATR